MPETWRSDLSYPNKKMCKYASLLKPYFRKLCLVKDPDEEISKSLMKYVGKSLVRLKNKHEHYDLGQFDVEIKIKLVATFVIWVVKLMLMK